MLTFYGKFQTNALSLLEPYPYTASDFAFLLFDLALKVRHMELHIGVAYWKFYTVPPRASRSFSAIYRPGKLLQKKMNWLTKYSTDGLERVFYVASFIGIVIADDGIELDLSPR